MSGSALSGDLDPSRIIQRAGSTDLSLQCTAEDYHPCIFLDRGRCKKGSELPFLVRDAVLPPDQICGMREDLDADRHGSDLKD